MEKVRNFLVKKLLQLVSLIEGTELLEYETYESFKTSEQ